MLHSESLPIIFGIACGATALIANYEWWMAEVRARRWEAHYRRASSNSYGLKWWFELQKLKAKQPKRAANGRFERKSKLTTDPVYREMRAGTPASNQPSVNT